VRLANVSSAASIDPPASRNAPCPCGSGRRYKDCHGSIATAAAPSGDLRQLLHAALAAQQAGRLEEAAARYTEALALDPANFDALHMLGVARFQRGEFEAALDSIERALARRPDERAARFNLELVTNALARRPAEKELEAEARRFAALPLATHDGDDRAVRVIAFYLPQYHRIPENDAWWGEGFTEWTNVRRARARFAGHDQPHVPGELGYYDLTDAAVREAQAALAREHGVDAFCYYHYWFGGRRLLEAPLDAVLGSGRPDFPFCLCWANESWTRRWDGREQDVLMAQRYAPGDARSLIEQLLPVFADRRHLRVNDRPLFLVYKPADMPDPAGSVAVWREVCRRAGLGDPYLAAVQRNALDDPTRLGFDAAVEFPPIGHAAESAGGRLREVEPGFRGAVYGYANMAADYLMRPRPAFRSFRGVTPSWDNTARRPDDGMVLAGSTPALFGAWSTHALAQTRLRHRGDERLLFVNAWNEWAEGNHLEPDQRHGRGFLEALRKARVLASAARPARPTAQAMQAELASALAAGAISVERFGGDSALAPGAISVVMPVYNHARFLERTLASLAAQTRAPGELVLVDDGSQDESVASVLAFARSAAMPVVLARQANAGAHVALNRGLALARGELIALANSDDTFAPERLARLGARLDEAHQLAFSGVALIDDDDRPAQGRYARELERRIAELDRAPSIYHVLIRHNPAVSTGNLVLRRSLLERTGGFAAYRVCHDWDFLLAATRGTRIARDPEPLYRYRLHAANTFAAGALAGRLEGEALLSEFFDGVATHPDLDASARAALLTFAREVGLAGYIR
jgi:tetratricopeptide (TPR) repeat protein